MFKCWNCGTEHDGNATIEQLRAAFDRGYTKALEDIRRIKEENK